MLPASSTGSFRHEDGVKDALWVCEQYIKSIPEIPSYPCSSCTVPRPSSSEAPPWGAAISGTESSSTASGEASYCVGTGGTGELERGMVEPRAGDRRPLKPNEAASLSIPPDGLRA